jgi:hypothetical protein
VPYYVYRVLPLAQLKKLAEFPSFRDASAHAKTLRAGDAPGNPGKIKIMFADNELLAEDLLCQIRDPGPAGDD